MLKNYLKIAIRNLERNKFYTFINVAGLSVGIACFVLIALFVKDELSYDQYHEQKDHIYRLVTRVEGASYEAIAKVNGPWGVAGRDEIPEVKNMARFVHYGTAAFTFDTHKNSEEGGFFADSTVFNIFSFPWLFGDQKTALIRPNTIVISDQLAVKYFGNSNPVGNTLFVDGESFLVTGVLRVPANSHFTFSFLIPMIHHNHPDKNSWSRWNQFYTYFLLKDGASPDAVATKMKSILEKNMDATEAKNYSPFLQPLTNIHLKSNLFRELEPNSDITYVYIFSAIGLLILTISCINYTNLASARATKRSKEVGMRKATGATRSQLIKQFLAESMLLCLIAVGISLLLVYSLLPVFNEFSGKHFTGQQLLNINALLAIVTLVFVVGFLAGSYPALFLSGLKPTEVLKGKAKLSANLSFRKGLMVFQFAISTFLFIGTVMLHSQLEYVKDKKLGYNSSDLITVPISNDSIRNHVESIKQQLERHSAVDAISVSGNLPIGGDYGIPYQVAGKEAVDLPPIRILVGDFDFIKTYGMELVKGRDFSKEFSTDASSAILINEEAAKQLEWSDPIGRELSIQGIGRVDMKVIGIVKDFHFRSLHEKIAPVMIIIAPAPNWYSFFSIRVKNSQLDEVIDFTQTQLHAYDPEAVFTFTSYGDHLGNLYGADRRTSRLISFFAIVAIFIASIGLLGLAAFSVEQRFKEIGVRKVLGASVGSITLLLSSDYLKLVLIGFVISIYPAYYLIHQWLEGFAYKVEVTPWPFLIAGLISLSVAFLTVSFQAIKAALQKPVDSIRNE